MNNLSSEGREESADPERNSVGLAEERDKCATKCSDHRKQGLVLLLGSYLPREVLTNLILRGRREKVNLWSPQHQRSDLNTSGRTCSSNDVVWNLDRASV